MANNNGEPSSAPQPERWYELKLGSSFKDNPSSKFCTLRYEFKPASIDKSQAGSLHKNKENRVTVEFPNNQPGKPKVTFEGSSEDYKDNDGVLFFDGETFRLERLHRAVKRLRHVRLPGESLAAANMSSATSAQANIESRSPPLGKTGKGLTLSKTVMHAVPVEVERIDIGEPESPGPRPANRGTDYHSAPSNPAPISPDPKPYEPEENVDITVDDDDGGTPPTKSNAGRQAAAAVSGAFGVILPGQNDTDDEVADVDVSEDEAGKGPNAAEALRAQVSAEEGQQHKDDDEESSKSSSSSSSGSGSSGSSSGSGSSSSSDSDGSDNDSASSGAEIEI